ncbi:MurR/RpiR family transcriptional regulator [Agromyces sp. MMS24-K17]|uniref:MurR/RpiR family transcriptional regulator n=1 Tax=Agromyces sp. MMS24-K17 TaxID=3372850 RepID=UPI003755329E
MTDLAGRVDAAWDGLGPGERRVAEHLREHPDDLLVRSSPELAAIVGVSKATVSRAVRRLGFDDLRDGRAALLAERARGVPVDPSPAPSGEAGARTGGVSAAERTREHELVDRALDALGDGTLGEVAALLARARRVLVIGLRGGQPVAMHLRRQLAQLRPDVSLLPLPGQALAEELVGCDDRDAVVLIAPRRRPPGVPGLLVELGASAVPVVLLAEPGADDLAAGVAAYLPCPVETAGAFDSVAGLVAATTAIANEVHRLVGGDARARARRIAEAYERIGEVR